MNSLFVIFALLGLLGSAGFDFSMHRKRKKPFFRFSMSVYGLSAVLLLLTYMQIRVPMPTYFFIHYVSPWFEALIS